MSKPWEAGSFCQASPGLIVSIEIDETSIQAIAFREDGLDIIASAAGQCDLTPKSENWGDHIGALQATFLDVLDELTNNVEVNKGQINAFAICTKSTVPIIINTAATTAAPPHDIIQRRAKKKGSKSIARMKSSNAASKTNTLFAKLLAQKWTSLSNRKAKITTPAAILISLLTGRPLSIDEGEAAATGLFDFPTDTWNRESLDDLTQGQAQKLASKLGPVTQASSLSLGTISQRLICDELRLRLCRTKIGKDCLVLPLLDASVAAYLSYRPHPLDVLLRFAEDDTLLMPISSPTADKIGHIMGSTQLFRNPLAAAQYCTRTSSFSSSIIPLRPFLAKTTLSQAGEARRIVRDSHANGKWPVFDRLLSAIPFGGSAGMDNKLFTVVEAPSSSLATTKPQDLRECGKKSNTATTTAATAIEICKFEKGIRVIDFGNPSANPRCLVEGQAMAVRALLSSRNSGGPLSITQRDLIVSPEAISLLQASCNEIDRNVLAPRLIRQLGQLGSMYRGAAGSLGFSPYDRSTIPTRILSSRGGQMTEESSDHYQSIAAVFSAVLGADSCVEGDDSSRGDDVEKEKSGITGCKAPATRPVPPSREALGLVYYALASLYASDGETLESIVQRFRDKIHTSENECEDDADGEGMVDEQGVTPRACPLNLVDAEEVDAGGRKGSPASIRTNLHVCGLFDPVDPFGTSQEQISGIRGRPRSSTVPLTKAAFLKTELSLIANESTQSESGSIDLEMRKEDETGSETMQEGLQLDLMAPEDLTSAQEPSHQFHLVTDRSGRPARMSVSLTSLRDANSPDERDEYRLEAFRATTAKKDTQVASSSVSGEACSDARQHYSSAPKPDKASLDAGSARSTRKPTARRDQLRRLARSDDDVWLIYGSLTEEYVRLASMSQLL